MKATLFLLLAAITTNAADTFTTPPLPNGTSPGRFTVVTGTPTRQNDPIAIRVDTATGQTWQLVNVPVPGKPESTTMGWVPLFENPIAAAEAAGRAVARSSAAPYPSAPR